MLIRQLYEKDLGFKSDLASSGKRSRQADLVGEKSLIGDFKAVLLTTGPYKFFGKCRLSETTDKFVNYFPI